MNLLALLSSLGPRRAVIRLASEYKALKKERAAAFSAKEAADAAYRIVIDAMEEKARQFADYLPEEKDVAIYILVEPDIICRVRRSRIDGDPPYVDFHPFVSE